MRVFFFQMRLMFKLVDSVKEITLPNAGSPHSISWNLNRTKRLTFSTVKEFPAWMPLNWDNIYIYLLQYKFTPKLKRSALFFIYQFQFSHPVVSNCLQPYGVQHARLPCPLPTPRACSNSFPLSLWSHQIISSSVIPFSSCLQSFPAPGSFLRTQVFASAAQSIGVSASASVMNI